ncbi:MAG: DMT family transporter [Persicimonas sp.]
MTRKRAIIELLLGATMISTSAVWVRAADVDPTAAGFWRMSIAAVVLLAVGWTRGWGLWRDARYFLGFLPVAAFFALDLFLWHHSIHYVGPGLATLLANFQVFFMAAVGALFLGETIGWRFPTGVGLAVPGVFLLVGVDLEALPPDYLTGVGLGLGTAVAYTGYLLGMRRAQRAEHTLPAAVNLLYASLWCSLLLAAMTALEGASFAIGDVESLGSMLIYGVVCQVIGWVLLTRSLPHLDASLVGLILLLQPALAMVWDVLFFGRPTGWFDLAGAALVLGGIYLASVRPRKCSAPSEP